MSRYKFPMSVALLVLAGTMLSGCEAIGTIFKAGVWVGVIVIVVILIIVGLIARAVRK